jgi:hypothetical protein
MADSNKADNIRKAKALWDAKQDRKFALVREQLKRTAERTPEQIEAQKERKALRRKKLA